MQFLRLVSRAKWIRASWAPWVPTGDVPADSVAELWTTDNRLSVYKADTKTEIDTAVAGIAAGRDNLSPVDYILIPPATLAASGIDVEASPGETHSASANALHADLIEISGLNLLVLAAAMADQLPKVRVARADVKAILQAKITAGEIDVAGLKPSLLSDLKITA
jgi:hypothetical protein